MPTLSVLWGQPAFVVSGRPWLWEDVLLLALSSGEWERFEQSARSALACVAHAAATGSRPDASALGAEADRFRRSLGLERADAARAWLEQRGLSTAAWMGHLERRLLQARWAAEVDDLRARYPADPDDLATVLYVDGACGGRLRELAFQLATRAAVVGAANGEGTGSSNGAGGHGEPAGGTRGDASLPIDPEAVSARLQARPWLGIPAEPARERTRELAALQDRFHRQLAEAASPARLQALLQANQVEWVHVELSTLRLEGRDAAREALLCLRDDGDPPELVARRAGASVEERRAYLDEVEPALRPAILGAKPMEWDGPVEMDGRHLVFQLRSRTAPSLEDRQVRERAVRRVAESVTGAALARDVQWKHLV